ncbi:MAG: DEAD/DEAH box helicase [Euryarchaeota archaeon]|nr:DEAD/DEAH box helicase [Euryarchaeota archaeon]
MLGTFITLGVFALPVRLRYRPEGDRLILRLEEISGEETRLWKLLQTMGCRTESEQVPGTLTWRRWIKAVDFPRLERASKLTRWELAPEAGEAVVASITGPRLTYESERPLDPAAFIEAAKSDPAVGGSALANAYATFDAWVLANPVFAKDGQADLKALASAMEIAREANRKAAAVSEAEEARELALELRGVAGEDAYAAHAALKRLHDAVKKVPLQPASPRRPMPEHIAHFRGKLRPYQLEGVRFLLERDLNAILADDMGTGKTIQAIAAVEAANERALVVGPANVLYNWKAEVERFTDEEAAIYHQGQRSGPADARFLITTYDSLQRMGAAAGDALERPVLVLDEAHYVRNHETLRSQLVRALPQKRRILLTGTPLVNGIEDYYELLRQVDADRWGSRSAFRETWLVEPALFNKYVQVRTTTANLLQRAARDVMLRRRKDDVLKDLPPRTVSVNLHELAPDRLREYRQLEERAEEAIREGAASGNELAVFAAIHALRQHLAVSRVPVVLERIRELLAAQECIVVYAHYLEPLHAFARELGPLAATIEGATPPKGRMEISKRLGQEGGPRVLLAQMEAGGVGLNFTAARHVLFVHFGWTPAVHAQAMDRVHRIGQDRPVFVEFFVTPDTIDERMVKILLRKEADQNLVLADESDIMNRNEVARLLAEDAARRVKAETAAIDTSLGER